jgi:hypothetical protein
MVTCGENGAQLLPSETGICAITGKRVDNELLGASELSGRTAIRTLLDSCAVTGRKALPSELQACDLTGKRVDPEELETCAVSHKRAIKSLFVRSDISGVPVLPEHAVCSPVSKRFCTPQESLPCTWSGVLFPKDEIVTCRLTGLTFSRDLMTPSNEFRVLREMLDGKQSGTHANDLVGWMATNLNGQVTGLKHARCTFSPEGSIRAVCGEMRAMLGLKVRYAGLLVNEKGTRQVLGRIAVGKRHQGTWTPGVDAHIPSSGTAA